MSYMGARILFVGHSAHRHGAELLGLNLVRSWTNDLGCEVHTLLLGGGELVNEYDKLSRSLHVLTQDAQRNPASLMKFLNGLRKLGCERAVCNTTVSGVIVPFLCDAGISSIALIHELPMTIRTLNLIGAAQVIGTLAGKVVFPAKIVRDGFEQFSTISAERISILPQGLFHNQSHLHNRDTSRISIRRKVGLRENSRLILNAGYLSMRKGADLLPSIAKQVLSNFDNAAFIWIGGQDPDMRSWLTHDIDMASLSSRVKFVPEIKDWELFSEFYAGSDVFFLPSREDPYPSVALEAMSFGLPVVCFQGATGAADLVAEGNAGIVVPYMDIAAMAQAITGLLTETSIWERASNNAIDCCRRQGSFQEYARKLVEILFSSTLISRHKNLNSRMDAMAGGEETDRNMASSRFRFF